MKREIVFGFDLGTSSEADAVRIGNRIDYASSNLIPASFASTKDAALRRRAHRTRCAHKARERWLQEQCETAGIEVLYGRSPEGLPGDPRLEREFSSSNDSTCYTSCLLRIKLLRGEELESWQIYKALRSASYRRGYDPEIPWRTGASKTEDAESEKKAQESAETTSALFKKMSPNVDYHLPCYLDAWLMGLWDPDTDKFNQRISHKAGKARGHVMPRKAVEKELQLLIQQAQTRFPQLPNANYLIYGPSQTAYGSFYPHIRENFELKEGAETDWQGLLGQKIPRFNNRQIGKCSLIGRLNVCKASDPLVWHAHFLLKLVNMRVLQNKQQRSLTPDEVSWWYNSTLGKESKKRLEQKEKKQVNAAKLANVWKITPTQWKRFCDQRGLTHAANLCKIPPPNTAGRSRFSRPALRLLRSLVLSGEAPKAFYERTITELPRGLVRSDLDFLKNIPNEWGKICIPDDRNSLDVDIALNKRTIEIRNTIAAVNDPIVRHRLSFFLDRINYLVDQYGEPDFVTLEFVREDFMGDKAKKQLETFQKNRKEERKKTRSDAEKLGLLSSTDLLKLELLKQQGGMCLYSSKPLIPEKVGSYVIDHIVPRRGGYYGSDAMFNKVVTTQQTNNQKADKYPHEWLVSTDNWEAYQERVSLRTGQLGKKKATLLLSAEAPALDERYTTLAETAWIAKLAQKIVSLRFGWPQGTAGSKKRIIVVSGGLVARVRRKYKLNELLAGNSSEKKNRDDKRHHALDAMIISYLPNWARDRERTDFFTFPEGINAAYFRTVLETVVPHYAMRKKPDIEEKIYRKRENYAFRRINLTELCGATKFSVKKGMSQTEKILDPNIKKALLAKLEANPNKKEWLAFCDDFTAPNGTATKKVTLEIGNIEEYRDLSKDGSGQYRRGKEHAGYFVYRDIITNKVQVKNVYAWQSQHKTKRQLREQGNSVIGFFHANSFVEIGNIKSKADGSVLIPAGKYLLCIQNLRTACFTGADGSKYTKNITEAVAAGLRLATE